jgi:peptide/nickel transport system ATP-binding protein
VTEASDDGTADTVGETPGTDREPLVAVRDLRKHYGRGGGPFADPPVKAVDGVTFDIRRGETLGLVGESGSGKSTLGRTLLRLEAATDGRVWFDGRDVTDLSGRRLREWRRDAQMVFQDPESSLNDRLTVGEIVREPLDTHDWRTPARRRERVRELLPAVGLKDEHYYRYPHQFSGGQRQRIAIARALALKPEFVVLDEPVSALDVSVQAKIITLLAELQAEFGLTYLVIAHDLSVVRRLCDRVAVMYLGKLMEIGETEALYADPANPYTRSLLSAVPEPDPTVHSGRIVLRGTPPSAEDPPAGCRFATRCPAKIRPTHHAGLTEAAWDAVERFRQTVRERSRLELGAVDRVRRRVGLFSTYDDVDAVVADLFADVDLPAAAEATVERAAELVKAGRPGEARDRLRADFGGVCDRDQPEHYRVGDGERWSRCHRHRPEYDDVAAVLDRRRGR